MCAFVRACACLCVPVRACVCVCVRMCVRVCVCVHVCIYTCSYSEVCTYVVRVKCVVSMYDLLIMGTGQYFEGPLVRRSIASKIFV